MLPIPNHHYIGDVIFSYHGDTDLFISISRSYIMISKVPFDMVDWESDSDIELNITGFDRLDGEDYYKRYEDTAVVETIREVIETLGIDPASNYL